MADFLNAGVEIPGQDVVLSSIAINGNAIDVNACHAVEGVGRILCLELGEADPSLPFISGSLKAMMLEDDQPLEAVWDALLRRSHRWLHERLLLDGQPCSARFDRGTTHGLLETSSQRRSTGFTPNGH